MAKKRSLFSPLPNTNHNDDNTEESYPEPKKKKQKRAALENSIHSSHPSSSSSASSDSSHKQQKIELKETKLTKDTYNNLHRFLCTTSLLSLSSNMSPTTTFHHIIFRNKAVFLAFTSTLKMSDDPYLCIDYCTSDVSCVGFTPNKSVLVLNDFKISNNHVFPYGSSIMEFQKIQVKDITVKKMYLCLNPNIFKTLSKSAMAESNVLILSFPTNRFRILERLSNTNNLCNGIIHEETLYLTQLTISNIEHVLYHGGKEATGEGGITQHRIPPNTSKINFEKEEDPFPSATPSYNNFAIILIQRKYLLQLVNDLMKSVGGKDTKPELCLTVNTESNSIKMECYVNRIKEEQGSGIASGSGFGGKGFEHTPTMSISQKGEYFSLEDQFNISHEVTQEDITTLFYSMIEMSKEHLTNLQNTSELQMLKKRGIVGLYHNLKQEQSLSPQTPNTLITLNVYMDILREVLMNIAEDSIGIILSESFPILIRSINNLTTPNCVCSVFVAPNDNYD
jgi:hypothetical protein